MDGGHLGHCVDGEILLGAAVLRIVVLGVVVIGDGAAAAVVAGAVIVAAAGSQQTEAQGQRHQGCKNSKLLVHNRTSLLLHVYHLKGNEQVSLLQR